MKNKTEFQPGRAEFISQSSLVKALKQQQVEKESGSMSTDRHDPRDATPGREPGKGNQWG